MLLVKEMPIQILLIFWLLEYAALPPSQAALSILMMPSFFRSRLLPEVLLSNWIAGCKKLKTLKTTFFLQSRLLFPSCIFVLQKLPFSMKDRLPFINSVSWRLQDANYAASQTWRTSSYLALSRQLWIPSCPDICVQDDSDTAPGASPDGKTGNALWHAIRAEKVLDSLLSACILCIIAWM